MSLEILRVCGWVPSKVLKFEIAVGTTEYDTQNHRRVWIGK